MQASPCVSVPTKGTHLLYDGNCGYGWDIEVFPSPRRGPIFSTLKGLVIRVRNTAGFRPHEGDPSSLHIGKVVYSMLLIVSVPTKGTHLLYVVISHIRKEVSQSFRPHEGDPSSLLVRGQKLSIWLYEFPSPRRGPIFSTQLRN